jgi:hypothetical protein
MEAGALETRRMAAERPQRPGLVRLGLVLLGLPQLAIGLWALISPSGWYETFPGAGHHWLPAFGSFDEHMASDVGAALFALGLLLLLAALWLERRVVQAALIGYLAFEIPHFAFHLGADDVLATGDRIASGITLALTVVVSGLLLALTRRPRPTAASQPQSGTNSPATPATSAEPQPPTASHPGT